MIITVLIFFILVLYQCHYISFNENYISRQTTKDINGIFVYLIVVSHFSSYIELTSQLDLMYADFRTFLGQLIVTTFLFYSGYGIMESIKNKKETFINTLPKRVLSLLIKLDMAIVIFLIFGFIIHRQFTIPQVIFSFIGWTTVGNSNWYIFVILVLYLLSFLIFKIFKDKYLTANIVLFICSVIFTYTLKYYRGNESWWYNTILCYSAGMFFSLFKNKIVSAITYNNITYIMSMILCIIIFLICKHYRSHLSLYQLHGIMFSFIITLLSMKFILKSRILSFLGDHIFSIYVLQRIPMVIGLKLHLNQTNNILYFIFSLCLVLIMAYYFDLFFDKINKHIFK